MNAALRPIFAYMADMASEPYLLFTKGQMGYVPFLGLKRSKNPKYAFPKTLELTSNLVLLSYYMHRPRKEREGNGYKKTVKEKYKRYTFFSTSN